MAWPPRAHQGFRGKPCPVLTMSVLTDPQAPAKQYSCARTLGGCGERVTCGQALRQMGEVTHVKAGVAFAATVHANGHALAHPPLAAGRAARAHARRSGGGHSRTRMRPAQRRCSGACAPRGPACAACPAGLHAILEFCMRYPLDFEKESHVFSIAALLPHGALRQQACGLTRLKK